MQARWNVVSAAGLPLLGLVGSVAAVAVIGTTAPSGGPQIPGAVMQAAADQSSIHGGSSHPCHGHAPQCVGSTSGAPGSSGTTVPGGTSGGTGPASSGGSTGSGSGGATGTGSSGGPSTGGGGASSPGAPQCFTGAWPVTTTSIPPGAAGGVYLRSDGSQLYLEVTHRGGRAVAYSGTLVSDGTLSASSFKLEPDDHFSVSPDGHVLSFRFVNHGALDGTAVTTTCGSTITLEADSAQQPARWMQGAGRTNGRTQRLVAPVTISRSS